jgi:hypothetical protein
LRLFGYAVNIIDFEWIDIDKNWVESKTIYVWIVGWSIYLSVKINFNIRTIIYSFKQSQFWNQNQFSSRGTIHININFTPLKNRTKHNKNWGYRLLPSYHNKNRTMMDWELVFLCYSPLTKLYIIGWYFLGYPLKIEDIYSINYNKVHK